ncbi:MAG: ATP-grasp domain-containing protein [Firmicutes bacterium]|nr:ATP-grasp domain-containing protein [Bacillota bacterium]
MRNIIIVEAVSTGYNLVEDARRRGYNPIVLEYAENEGGDIKDMRKAAYARFYKYPQIIKASKNYAETLAEIKKYHPILVVASSDHGIELASRLSEDLGLLGNPYKTVAAMTRKDAMHEALKKAGIRYIKGKVIKTAEEAVAFCQENGFSTAVIKPLQSSGSQGLFLCDDLEEVKKAAETIMTYVDTLGFPIRKALIQERIVGTEYIVNTASCKGEHRLNSLLKYKKVKTSEGGYIYDYCETLSHPEQGHTELIEYAFKVADAIGFKYGVIHGEYMIDEKGPVLIEVNCRPMGGSIADEYLDMIFGQHETDAMLDAYLDPEGFKIKAKRPYGTLKKGVLKFIMIPNDMEAEDHPVCVIAKQLESTYKIAVNDSTVPVYYLKTRDLDTTGGTIFLVHSDENAVMSDLALLRETEQKYFSLLLNDGMSRRWFADANVATTDFERIIKECNCHGAILAAGDKAWEREGIQTATPQTIDDVHKGFDCVIIGYQLSLLDLKESACLEVIFKTMDKVKNGGRVIIPQSTYEYLSYKREGAELLMRIKHLTIQVPFSGLNGYVIGVKEDRSHA